MTSPQNKTNAPYRPRRATLNRVDYLLIAMTALVFVGALAINNTHSAHAQTRSSIIPASALPSQDAQMADRTGLIKARIGLALAGR